MSDRPEIVDPPRPASLLLSYLRLFRLPNVFTAMADVAMGFLFVQQSLAHVEVFLCLLGASSCLYTAGMVLNDVYDVEVDRLERPSRPLPSGRISVDWAKWLGYELLLVGLALGWLSGLVMHGFTVAGVRSGAVATALAACIVLYDAVLKKTIVGPWTMGGCRFLNVLLGMSIAGETAGSWLWGFSPAGLIVAGGIGLYIVGVTWFARSEADESHRGQLALGLAGMVAGIALLCFLPFYLPQGVQLKLDEKYWPVLLILVCLPPLRRCGIAVLDPSPSHVQIAVKVCILTLIVLDAGVVMALAGWYYAIGVLALLIPSFFLGRWVYST